VRFTTRVVEPSGRVLGSAWRLQWNRTRTNGCCPRPYCPSPPKRDHNSEKAWPPTALKAGSKGQVTRPEAVEGRSTSLPQKLWPTTDALELLVSTSGLHTAAVHISEGAFVTSLSLRVMGDANRKMWSPAGQIACPIELPIASYSSPREYAISTPIRSGVRRNHGVSCNAVCGLATTAGVGKVLKTLMVQAFSSGAGCRLKIARSPVQPRDSPLDEKPSAEALPGVVTFTRDSGSRNCPRTSPAHRFSTSFGRDCGRYRTVAVRSCWRRRACDAWPEPSGASGRTRT
jgi:hypothetical protein